MLIEVKDNFDDLCMLGTGYIYTPEGQAPVKESLAGTTPKLSFMVTVRVKKVLVNADEMTSKYKSGGYTYAFKTVNCAIYSNKNNNEIYALARTLQNKELITFTGKQYESSYATDSNTDEVKIYSEIRIESFILPNRLAALNLGRQISEIKFSSKADGDKPKKSFAEDEYYF